MKITPNGNSIREDLRLEFVVFKILKGPCGWSIMDEPGMEW